MSNEELNNEDWQTGEEFEDAFSQTGLAFPDADQASMDDILEQPVLVEDFVVREGLSGEYAIMLVRVKQAQNEWSVPCGGKVVMKWLNYIKQHNYIPIVAVFVKQKSKSHRGFSYYIPMSTKQFENYKKGKIQK